MRNAKPVATGVKIMSDVHLVNFSVMQNHLTGRIDEDGGVKDLVIASFENSGTHEHLMLSRASLTRG